MNKTNVQILIELKIYNIFWKETVSLINDFWIYKKDAACKIKYDMICYKISIYLGLIFTYLAE